jgi:hypothetical protein
MIVVVIIEVVIACAAILEQVAICTEVISTMGKSASR